ncbi:MAG: RloB family protein [Anaerolineae bacterium]
MSRKKKPSGNTMGSSRRSEANYLRSEGTQPSKSSIYIFCEGSKTERGYFRSLKAAYRLATVQVEAHPVGDPIGLVEYAIAHVGGQRQNDDQVWCVFDTERLGTHGDIDGACELARRNDVLVAVSNPCFEYWFLLHYECTDSPFEDADHVITRLRRYVPRYEKNMAMYACLGAKTPQALLNAGHLRELSPDAWDTRSNPSTSVDTLIKVLLP